MLAKLHQGKIDRKKINTANRMFPNKATPGLIKLMGSSVKEYAKEKPKNNQNKRVRRISGQKIRVGKDIAVRISTKIIKHNEVPRTTWLNFLNQASFRYVLSSFESNLCLSLLIFII